jgi:hypothetical protein
VEEVEMDNAVGASIGTPEHLIAVARQGRLPKEVLVQFLAIDKRPVYLDACGAIEKRYTEECAATGDPCLEGGCAVEGEICLQPILRAGLDYLKGCGDEWVKLFADPRNRVEAWRS